MFEWIVFDIDDTLLDFDTSESAALTETIHKFDLPSSNDFHRIYKSVNYPLWQALERGELTVKEIKKTRFGLFAKELGKELTEKESALCNSFYLENLSRQAPLLKGAGIVRDLKPRYNMGILTNGMELPQQNRMHHSGLKDCFSFLVSSEKTGFAKPDERIFRAAWEQMGRPERNRVLMVGDNPLSDISGGRAFGFKTCWINRRSDGFPYEWQPDFIVENPGKLDFLLN